MVDPLFSFYDLTRRFTSVILEKDMKNIVHKSYFSFYFTTSHIEALVDVYII